MFLLPSFGVVLVLVQNIYGTSSFPCSHWAASRWTYAREWKMEKHYFPWDIWSQKNSGRTRGHQGKKYGRLHPCLDPLVSASHSDTYNETLCQTSYFRFLLPTNRSHIDFFALWSLWVLHTDWQDPQKILCWNQFCCPEYMLAHCCCPSLMLPFEYCGQGRVVLIQIPGPLVSCTLLRCWLMCWNYSLDFNNKYKNVINI